jgi:hypothetical protein
MLVATRMLLLMSYAQEDESKKGTFYKCKTDNIMGSVNDSDIMPVLKLRHKYEEKPQVTPI